MPNRRPPPKSRNAVHDAHAASLSAGSYTLSPWLAPIVLATFTAACSDSNSDDRDDSPTAGRAGSSANPAASGGSTSGASSGAGAPAGGGGSRASDPSPAGTAGSGGGVGGVAAGGATSGGAAAGGQGGSGAPTTGGGGLNSAGAGGAGGVSGAAGSSSGGNGGVGGGAAGQGGNASAGSTAQGGTTSTPKPLPATWIPVTDYRSTKSNIMHGRIEVTTYDSPTLQMVGSGGRKASVYLPPAYDASKKYPVLYALHGGGGTHREWIDTDSYPQQILDNLYAANKIVPMIVVFPNGRAMKPDTPPRANATEAESQANLRAFDVFWSKDFEPHLIPHIEQKYSVYTDKAHRAVLGYSMGGMQALQFGLGNPARFAYVGALSPAPIGLGLPAAATLDANTVRTEFVHVFLSCGTNDSLMPGDATMNQYQVATNYHASLQALGIPHIWVPVAGGAHDGTTWAPGLYNFAQIIFQ